MMPKSLRNVSLWRRARQCLALAATCGALVGCATNHSADIPRSPCACIFTPINSPLAHTA